MEELAADNFLSTASRFGKYKVSDDYLPKLYHHIKTKQCFTALNVVDENAHDEGSSIKYRKGSEIDTASRFAIDQALDAENFNENAVEAAAESVDENAASRDVSTRTTYGSCSHEYEIPN